MHALGLPFSSATEFVLLAASTGTGRVSPNLVRRLNRVDGRRQGRFVISGKLLGLITTLLLAPVKSFVIAVGSSAHRAIYS